MSIKSILYTRNWRKKNPEKVRLYNLRQKLREREYYKKNKEHVLGV